MDAYLKDGLWQQFGASIAMLENAVDACPDHLWDASMWKDPDGATKYSRFWYRVYHTLFWLDLYLTGTEEGFLPPPPFTLIEQDENGPLPERPYTKGELKAYLEDCRQRCRATIESMTDEMARRRCAFSWGEASFFELQLYNMRHVQDHAAHLNMMLGQQGIPVIDWEAQAGR